jgi:uncharacterized iron-regulated membrane protein
MSHRPVLPLVRRNRTFRVWHRSVGIYLAILVLISSLTGFLLAWKKQMPLLQPKEHLGISTDVNAWAPMALLYDVAVQTLSDSLGTTLDEPLEIDRLDARPHKGIVKVIFTNHWEVQVDATTGIVYSVGRRHADWIEKVHDGSIISESFKWISMTGLSIGLCLLTLTGIYLWWKPKKSIKP